MLSPIYSCHYQRLFLAANANLIECYLETEFYGEACLYHSLGYSVIQWPEGNKPSIEGHKMLLAQSESSGQTNFQPNS